MKETMYDILKKAARKIKEGNLDCVQCTCPTHGKFMVYAR